MLMNRPEFIEVRSLDFHVTDEDRGGCVCKWFAATFSGPLTWGFATHSGFCSSGAQKTKMAIYLGVCVARMAEPRWVIRLHETMDGRPFPKHLS
jgi:hypothetical protein